MKSLILSLALLIAGYTSSFADNYNRDTLWMKNTDQSEGFYMLKFSQNDSTIAAFGYQNTIFYEAKTGNEIARIDGNKNGFFIKNDSRFLKLRSDGKTVDIYDLNSYKIVDSLESDGLDIYDNSDISIDNRFYISTVAGGLRIWDMDTKKIIRTKIFDFSKEVDLISWGFGKVKFHNCNPNQIIAPRVKKYKIPNSTPPQTKEIGSLSIFDINSLDSISEIENKGQIVLSKNCKYYAYKLHDNNYGIELYDFQTKKLLYKLPVNGLNVTGLEFTSDEKYLIYTYPIITILDILNNKVISTYNDGSYNNIAVSHNNNNIISSSGRYLLYYKAHYGTNAVTNPTNTTNAIYPNPTNGLVTISTSCLMPQVQFTISNQAGQIINTSIIQNTNNQIQLNFSQYPIGNYYIELQCNQDVTNYKIIKE